MSGTTSLMEILIFVGGLLTGILGSIAFMFITNQLHRRRWGRRERELVPLGARELAERALRTLDVLLEEARRTYEKTERLKRKTKDGRTAYYGGRS